MAKALTAKFIENVRYDSRKPEHPDGGCRGLRLVVHRSGGKSWIVRYRRPPPDKRPAKLTHEHFVPLAEARKWATAALAELAQGRDPGALKAAAKQSAEQAEAGRKADTVAHWAAQFLDLHARRNNLADATFKQYERGFRQFVLPEWGARSIRDFHKANVRELVERVALDRPIAANRLHAALSVFGNWLAERDVIPVSFCAGVKRPSKEQARERILSDDEIRRLWLACDSIGNPSGALVKVLALTGQRRSEVSGMRRAEIIGGDVWSLSPERTKNGRRHDIPLSGQVLEIVNAMPAVGDSDLIFTTTGGPLTHFHEMKLAIDAHMKPDSAWVFHDLRRSAASGMARLGVALPVIEKVLNHASGSFAGIVGVYQRHDYSSEKRNALQRWADHIDAIVHGEPVGKVVALRSRP
jgi:integrase